MPGWNAICTCNSVVKVSSNISYNCNYRSVAHFKEEGPELNKCTSTEKMLPRDYRAVKRQKVEDA